MKYIRVFQNVTPFLEIRITDCPYDRRYPHVHIKARFRQFA